MQRMKLISASACLALAALGVSACSSQAWYASVRQGAENNCRKQPSSAAEECLARLNKASYESYEKERADLK